jgi:origin recognition complex subunit 5
MALPSPFQLPNELLLSTLITQFPCREPQIRSLAALLSVRPSIPKVFSGTRFPFVLSAGRRNQLRSKWKLRKLLTQLA